MEARSGAQSLVEGPCISMHLGPRKPFRRPASDPSKMVATRLRTHPFLLEPRPSEAPACTSVRARPPECGQAPMQRRGPRKGQGRRLRTAVLSRECRWRPGVEPSPSCSCRRGALHQHAPRPARAIQATRVRPVTDGSDPSAGVARLRTHPVLLEPRPSGAPACTSVRAVHLCAGRHRCSAGAPQGPRPTIEGSGGFSRESRRNADGGLVKRPSPSRSCRRGPW